MIKRSKKITHKKITSQINKNNNTKVSRWIYWTPRILSIIFILFLALMSLDIFDLNLNFWQTVIGLFMHNIPALILLAVLLVSWRYEIVGGITFILAGLFYIFLLLRNQFEWYMISWVITIAGPALLIGILFMIGWYKKKR